MLPGDEERCLSLRRSLNMARTGPCRELCRVAVKRVADDWIKSPDSVKHFPECLIDRGSGLHPIT